MERGALVQTSRRLRDRARADVTKTPERKWTAAGIGLGFGAALILVPPLAIAAFGGAIAGWWIVVRVVTVFGAFAGNRASIEMERRRAKQGKRNGPIGGVIASRKCRVRPLGFFCPISNATIARLIVR